MKLISVLSLVLLLNHASAQTKPVVIVELFTSEGCSSCPPADRLLAAAVEKNDNDVEVIGLSFHVDYWDYIGWKDPYASSEFTQRQRSYARKFQSSQMYTPQMIVNGTHEFVGSDRKKLNSALNKEKKKQSEVDFNIKVIDRNKEQLVVTISSNQKDKAILNVVVVEKDLSQEVKRGENRGRTLKHDHVVRAFSSRQFDGQTHTFKLDLPEGLDISQSSLVVYAQKEDTWEVIDGQKLDLKLIN
ncbi:MAG: DUF1223 domain-containing protein [Bacteroidota bacterium]